MAPSGEPAPLIVTEGSGEDQRTADRAELTLSFLGRGPDRAAAVADLGSRLVAARDPLGRPALQVRHRRLQVCTEWRGKRPRGCAAREHLELLVTDLTTLEELLGALLGAEPEGLHGPRWTLADAAEAIRVAQRGAVDDARRRAQGYAEALGGRLGALLRLDEAPDHGRPVLMAARAVEGDLDADVRDLGLEPEPVRTTARCTTTWTLLPP